MVCFNVFVVVLCCASVYLSGTVVFCSVVYIVVSVFCHCLHGSNCVVSLCTIIVVVLPLFACQVLCCFVVYMVVAVICSC